MQRCRSYGHQTVRPHKLQGTSRAAPSPLANFGPPAAWEAMGGHLARTPVSSAILCQATSAFRPALKAASPLENCHKYISNQVEERMGNQVEENLQQERIRKGYHEYGVISVCDHTWIFVLLLSPATQSHLLWSASHPPAHHRLAIHVRTLDLKPTCRDFSFKTRRTGVDSF